MKAKGSFFLGVAMAALLLLHADAQTAATGAIVGSVLDPSSAAIASAEVTAQSSTTNITRRTQTDETGSYNISLLPPIIAIGVIV